MSEHMTSSEDPSAAQIAARFEAALDAPDVWAHLRGLMELEPDLLRQEVQQMLTKLQLSWSDAARLFGVTEWTVERWRKAEVLPPEARPKLAALTVLLSLATQPRRNRSGPELVKAALEALDTATAPAKAIGTDDATRIVMSVFGAAGVMALALHATLTETTTGCDPDP